MTNTNYCIFRADKLKTHQDVVNVLKEQHRDESYDSKRADKELSHLNTYSDTYAQAIQNFDKLLPEKIRKNAVVGLNFLVSTSNSLSSQDEKTYYENARKFIEKRFGKIVGWAIHRDETSTHMQIVTIPLVDGKLNARALIGGSKDRLRALQSEFFEEVGKPFGLVRGKENSQAQHKTVEQHHREEEQKLEKREILAEEKIKKADEILKTSARIERDKNSIQEFKKNVMATPDELKFELPEPKNFESAKSYFEKIKPLFAKLKQAAAAIISKYKIKMEQLKRQEKDVNERAQNISIEVNERVRSLLPNELEKIKPGINKALEKAFYTEKENEILKKYDYRKVSEKVLKTELNNRNYSISR